MKNLIQSGDNVTHSIDRLEEKVSRLVNTINDRNEKTLPNTFLTISDSPAILMKNHDILEILTKIQFHHKTFNLTNSKPLTDWQVLISIGLNLKMNVTPIFNVVIQFHFLNLC